MNSPALHPPGAFDQVGAMAVLQGGHRREQIAPGQIVIPTGPFVKQEAPLGQAEKSLQAVGRGLPRPGGRGRSGVTMRRRTSTTGLRSRVLAIVCDIDNIQYTAREETKPCRPRQR